MSILTKTAVKNIFVTNAVPQQVDYSNWIDSCAFLNAADSSLPVASLVMPLIPALPQELPPSGYYKLYFDQSNSDKLSVITDVGTQYAVCANKYLTFSFDQAVALTTGQKVLLITKIPLKIVSVKASSLYVGNYSIDMNHLSSNGPISSVQSVIAGVAVDSPSATSYTQQTFTVLDDTIPADRVLVLGVTVNSGTFIANITIEYREDL